MGVFAALALFLYLSSCSPAPNPWDGLPGPPRVVTTFPPLECFARNLAGDNVGVLSLATSSGPHHYEPDVEETLKLRQADLFFVNGLQLDDRFADRMAQSSNNRRLAGKDAPGLVKLGDRLLKEPGLVDRMEHGDHDHGHAHHDHQHGEHDPHIWLGIPQAIRMVEIIRDELKKVDAGHAAEYDRRAAEYVKELKDLHEYGKKALAGKKERSLVTNHESLHYFAKSFDLDIVDVIQVRPGADPGSLTDLIKTCQEKKVRVIATEPQFQRGTAETLQEELRRRGLSDAVIINLDPLETVLEGDTVDRGWYVRKMKQNLDTLAGTLK
jgi:ABC-type Zn uptake system ZnuABC Zn-binding protein ZnuA